jgi:hypothetical protein
LARLYRRRRAWADWPQDVPRPRELARLIAELLLELHRLGLRHRDLHPGNLLLVREGACPRLQVLDLLELEEMPGRQSLIDHLVQLNHFFEPLATRTERLRGLQMLDERGLRLLRQARRIEAATRRYRREFYRSRDGRCLRRSKYFRRVRTPGLTGFVAADWAERLPQDDAELLAALEIRQPVKQSRHETSGFGLIGGVRVFIKRDVLRPGVVRLDWLLRGTRQRRAWVRANALLVRGIRTARPLAWLDVRHGLRGREGIFVAEALDGWRSLDAALAEPGLPAHPGAPGLVRASGPARRVLIETVAREVRRLHDAGLSNRDLKAQNILVRYDGRAWRTAFVDMTGLRRQRWPVGRGRRIQNLMRLAFSWSGVGISGQARGLTRTDCLRFLKTYLGPHCRQAITLKCHRVPCRSSPARRKPGVGGSADMRSRGASPPYGRVRTEELRRWWRDIAAALAEKAAVARR